MSLYQSSVLNKYLATQDAEQVAKAFNKYTNYFLNKEIQENIRNANEEQFQQKFLMELFVNVFGYVMNPDAGYNLTTELKNIKDTKKTDGAILKADGAALAVIELKGTDTKNLGKVNDQAFNYKNNQPECVYVITSNFEKLRFFIHNAVEHEEFNLFTLTEERFTLMWLFLQKDNLLGGIPAKIKEESLLQEDKITKALYADYSSFKNDLWNDMVHRNPQHDPLLLYKKSQKLLDRFLFIFFAEDKGLLPPNSISTIVEQWQKLKDLDEYKPLYDRFKKYFRYMNDGYKGAKYEIHAYNGGLFLADELLHGLLIDDKLLKKHSLKLSNYDFADEVDTNILGHIFEHSLNDIENVRAQLAGEEVDKSKTKRKKDGVFYTPKYITKYIVDNTVGKLCEEKKSELSIDDEEFAKDRKGRRKETLKKLHAQLKEYREWLLQLTICDPACGSGAFLNQALEFLIAEHRYLDELEAQLFKGSIVFQDVENQILENNIYGVDINEESVEIARLSLWLRTAQKGRKLTSLSSNIKCGNSLIDDPEVAGVLAFNWQQEFPRVFKKGGFDVVIGNPPYGVIHEKEMKEYFQTNFQSFQGNLENYCFFVELFIKLTRDKSGNTGLIVPLTWLTIPQFKNLRILVLQNQIHSIVELPTKVFSDADLDTLILCLSKRKPSEKIPVEIIHVETPNVTGFEIGVSSPNSILSSKWEEDPDKRINLYQSDLVDGILLKIRANTNPLCLQFKVAQGIVPYARREIYKIMDKEAGDHIIDNRLWHSDYQVDETFKKELKGEDVNRYMVKWNGHQWVKYGSWLAFPRKPEYFEKPRVLIREITRGKGFNAGYANEELYNNPGIINVINVDGNGYSLKALLGIINSKLMFYYHLACSPKARLKTSIPKVLIKDIENFPLPNYEQVSKTDLVNAVNTAISVMKDYQDGLNQFLELLQSKFDLPKPSTKVKRWPSLDFKGFLTELKRAKVPPLSLDEEAEWMGYFNKKKEEANAFQSEIARIDNNIDQMVYELYGLTEEEIQIVENN